MNAVRVALPNTYHQLAELRGSRCGYGLGRVHGGVQQQPGPGLGRVRRPPRRSPGRHERHRGGVRDDARHRRRHRMFVESKYLGLEFLYVAVTDEMENLHMIYIQR